MIRIMRADMYRVFHGKAIYITLAAMLTLVLSMVLVFVVVEAINGVTAAQLSLSSTGSSIYIILPLIVVISMATISSGAIKNELSTGLSRTRLYLSRWTLSSILSIVFMLLYLFLFIIIPASINGFGDWGNGFFTQVLQTFGAQMIFILAANSIGVFFCFTIRKTAAVISIYIALFTVPAVIINLLSMAFPSVMENAIFDLTMLFQIFSWLPDLSHIELIRGLAVGLAYILISTIGGILLFQKAEIK